eukprot:gene18083-235_t
MPRPAASPPRPIPIPRPPPAAGSGGRGDGDGGSLMSDGREREGAARSCAAAAAGCRWVAALHRVTTAPPAAAVAMPLVGTTSKVSISGLPPSADGGYPPFPARSPTPGVAPAPAGGAPAPAARWRPADCWDEGAPHGGAVMLRVKGEDMAVGGVRLLRVDVRRGER